MLDHAAVLKIIFGALENLNAELDDDAKVAISADTPLFGTNAAIDSLALVSVLVDVETAVSDALGRSVSLTDDKAISQAVSPFTDPTTLAAYITTLAAQPA